LKEQGGAPPLVTPEAVYGIGSRDFIHEILDLAGIVSRFFPVPASLDAHQERGHVRELPRHDTAGKAKTELLIIKKLILTFVEKDIFRLRGRNTSEVPAVVAQENHVYIIAHKLDKGIVRNIHIAVDNDLLQFIGKKGMIGCIALLDQEMPPLLDDSCALCSDIYDHVPPPVFTCIIESGHG